jgi:hypothetical protein
MEEFDLGYITPEEQIITKEKALKKGPPKVIRNQKSQVVSRLKNIKEIDKEFNRLFKEVPRTSDK